MEGVVARDVDLVEVERMAAPDALERVARVVAEVAAGAAEEGDDAAHRSNGALRCSVGAVWPGACARARKA